MEPATLVIIGIAVTVIINLLVFATALGGYKGTVRGHTSLLATQTTKIDNLDKRVNNAMLQLAVVAATCEAYFAKNPNPQASLKMGEVVKSLERMQAETQPVQEAPNE